MKDFSGSSGSRRFTTGRVLCWLFLFSSLWEWGGIISFFLPQTLVGLVSPLNFLFPSTDWGGGRAGREGEDKNYPYPEKGFCLLFFCHINGSGSTADGLRKARWRDTFSCRHHRVHRLPRPLSLPTLKLPQTIKPWESLNYTMLRSTSNITLYCNSCLSYLTPCQTLWKSGPYSLNTAHCLAELISRQLRFRNFPKPPSYYNFLQPQVAMK